MYKNDNDCARLMQIGAICTVSKNIPDIFDCNLKTNYQILIIFDKHISDTTCH